MRVEPFHEWDGSPYIIKGTPESSCAPYIAIGGHSEKKSVCELGSRSSPDTESADAMMLDFTLGPGLIGIACAYLQKSYLRIFCK